MDELKYRAVKAEVVRVLKAVAAIDPDSALYTLQIWEKGREKFESLGLHVAGFGNWLTNLRRDASSGVICPGKKQGYYYQQPSRTMVALATDDPDSLPSEMDELTPVAQEARKKYLQREAQLYPAFQEWLLDRQYRAEITAANKKGGRWGNPDITGIRIADLFDIHEIEVTTIEVKLDSWNWNREDIFEAISHRRFANRSYFAFAIEENECDLSSELFEKIRYYATVFGIGILAFKIQKDLFTALHSSLLPDASLQGEIVEVQPAPYFAVRLNYQREYLRNVLDIQDTVSLCQWGAAPNDE